MTNYIIFDIHGEPKGKARPRFKKSGHAYTPKDTANYEKYVRWCFGEQAKKTGFKMIEADKPVSVAIYAYFQVPKSFSKAKRKQALSGNVYSTKKPDCDNIIKVICDALNGMAYADDKQIISVFAVKRYSEENKVTVAIKQL